MSMRLFLALGFVPSLMAKVDERCRKRRLQGDKSKPVLLPSAGKAP